MLRQVQQHHPLLRVRIATDVIGQPKFVETDNEIPLRLVAITDDRHWQAELEVELARSLDWQVAPLLRVVLLQSGAESELMIICHHAIADGLSGIYLMRDILQGLGGKIFERSHLCAALSLESALPGIAPTLKRVEVAVVAIVQFRDDKLAHEHIYWDQASVLVQLGLLDPSKLPVVGVESARKALDPSLPSNALIERASDRN